MIREREEQADAEQLPPRKRLTRRRERASSITPTSPVKRILVDHTYIDHLEDDDDLPARIPLIHSGGKKPQRGPRGGVTVAFPEKLHEMLAQTEEEDLGHVVSWQPHGRCFLVHEKKEFVESVMPR